MLYSNSQACPYIKSAWVWQLIPSCMLAGSGTQVDQVVKKIDNALSDIDDNMLQYCSLDKKVFLLNCQQNRCRYAPVSVSHRAPAKAFAATCLYVWSRLQALISLSGTGIKAKVQADFRREGAGIPGCPTGM